jgi:hypothetical protein
MRKFSETKEFFEKTLKKFRAADAENRKISSRCRRQTEKI